MARPRNKADLIVAATENFEKLVKMIEEMSDEEKAKENKNFFSKREELSKHISDF